ncbi:response regulator [Altibacter sp. HG106]|uniref:response regulator n=1 Tax=Altibacter sp. HG106 TaxID=3023937 RepID=UPI0023500320|nr:response regulator transcription factor [Altibacter sp. HG106]MDC7995101.1 response regulator transcription factor [Altibacter sp. HG106]
MEANIKIVIADDHPLLLEGIVSVIQKHYPEFEIYKASNGASALQLITEEVPDIAILDIEMPLLNGIEVATKSRALNVATKIVFLTLHKEKSFFDEIQRLDVEGYVLKEFSIQEIIVCIEKVLKGETYYSSHIQKFLQKGDSGLPQFTKTETNILKLIAQGRTSKEIAEMLFVSQKTVDSHRYNISKKLNLPGEKNSLLKWVLKNASRIKG